MRLNSFDGHYNIDFEILPDLDSLGEWISKNLPNIGFVEIIYNRDDPKIFHTKNNKQSVCQLRILDLIENNKYEYQDIQARGLFYIDEPSIDIDDINKFFIDLAIFLDMNIYIPWNDVAIEILDWTDICCWCINGKEKKIVFDAAWFGDFSQTYYLEGIPHKQFRKFKPL